MGLKYAGFVPKSLAYGYDGISIGIQIKSSDEYIDGKVVVINVYGRNGSGNSAEYSSPIETFEGATNPSANIGGENIFLENIINNKSQFISVRVFNELENNASGSSTEQKRDFDSYTKPTLDDNFLDGVKEGYTFFRDFELSNATLVINPFVKNGNFTKTEGEGGDAVTTTFDFMSEIDSLTSSLVAYRKNCMAVVGYPIDVVYNKTSIETYFNSGVASNALGNKFCIALQGREYVSVFGQRFTLNCVGGYCGAMVNTAKEVRINQIASGYTYGMYGGSLKESLKSGEVIDLMEEGIDSIYTSKRGNLIWGTRTMYSRQTSYFGKANVMRVCSMILRNIFPIAVETLHTDAASNPITRASLSTMLNSIIDTYIANQDLHADSYADCSDALNTDYLTKGGTVLNIVLMLHFIGLVERVSIKIIATDTSVTAEFV